MVGFIIGVFVGMFIGVFTMCLMQIAKEDDKE